MLQRLGIILVLCISNVLNAQNEANIWYFGENAGLNFNSGSPVALLDGALYTNEGCATISDSNGNLLFYTDGVTVYNRNHLPMLNGTGLLGSFSSTHSAIIVPFIQNAGFYYIFTVDTASNNPDTYGLAYSIVDMSLDNTLGAVTATKNVQMETPVNEKVMAVKNNNEDGYWVVSHRHNTSEFISYAVTDFVVPTNPVISDVGENSGFFGTTGQMKISPDASKLVVSRGSNLQLFDFNNQTGVVSNAQTLLFPIPGNSFNTYGVEFSPNGGILYVAYYEGVFQYNLQAGTLTDIINSRITLSYTQGQGYASMQLGPDGKIYVAKTFRKFIDVIEKPNTLGSGCDYILNGISLNGRTSRLGLPTFVSSFFQANFIVDNTCFGNTSYFSANITQSYNSILWDFGDGNTSNLENPIHIYTSPGDYNIVLTVFYNLTSVTENTTITIYDFPSVASIVQLYQCDDNLDGFSTFNLTEANVEISTNYLNETISFYESQLDAETNTNAITEPTIYTNQTINTDSVWARIENANGCFETSQVNLNISTTQIPNTFFRDFYECDAVMDQQDGISIFDFSSVHPEVQALFPAGQMLDISYYENLADAFSETNPIADITNYSNSTPFIQDIFIRVENLLNNDCLGLGPYITLHVLEVPLVTGPIMMEQCDISGDGIELFDTSNIENELSLGQTGTVTFTYEDELGNTLSSPLPNPLSSNQAILNVFATMSYQDANSPDGACSVQTTISFEIFNSIIVDAVPDFIVCDEDSDGQFGFDTATIENTILNGEIADITYRDENGITLTNPLPNPFVTGTQTITATVTEPTNPMCFTDVEINFIVNNQPIANVVQDDFVCDDVSNDGEHLFNLIDYNSQVLNGQPSTLFSISYHVSQTDAEINNNPLPSSYLSAVTSETIFVRIENNNSTSCFHTTSFQIGVSYLPIANQPEDFNMCDAGNDGIEFFNLPIMDGAILNGQSNTMFTVSYHGSQQDADLNNNPFIGPYISSVVSETIFVRLENNLNTNCFSTTQFSIILNEQPVLNMEDIWSICKGDDSIELEADEGYDNYLWSTGDTTRIITVLNPGTYTITASNTYQNFICDVAKTISVVESNIATITNIETIDWSQNNNAILVEVEGSGDYEYSLDGLTYQDSNQFNNLSIDDYTVYIRDKNGCGVTSEEVYLLFYPNYFTPNGDTFHDTWQIYNTDKEPNNEIYIFDRYGKLLTQIKTNGLGWDGIVNGKLMPTSDYWFLLKRQNGKQYRGHFTLRR